MTVRAVRSRLGLAVLALGVALVGLTAGTVAHRAAEGARYCGAGSSVRWSWRPPWPRCTTTEQTTFGRSDASVEAGTLAAAVLLLGAGALLRKGSQAGSSLDPPPAGEPPAHSSASSA